ncbi:hypothetical protein ACFPL7_19645 [Dongia soli]|uniref:Uncharacterized protein n=1 Tax=Dongia soli TaxID=600628 RepID=A0ABU5E680_9PROT|nr:hypothetical protein [Dongia soli]MDY0881803.1 hypothetical protein [Dongia soli]
MSETEERGSDAVGPTGASQHDDLSAAPQAPAGLLETVPSLDAGLADLMSDGEDNVTFNLVDANSPEAGAHGIGIDPTGITSDGITLGLDDVLSIGTESIGGLDALMVTGDQGDIVRLRTDGIHNWEPAAVETPSGFTAYHATTGSETHDPAAGHHAHHDIYVLVQQDLHVILNFDQG